MSLNDWALLHTATTTFSSPLVYTLGTNAVTFVPPPTSALTIPYASSTAATIGNFFASLGGVVIGASSNIVANALTVFGPVHLSPRGGCRILAPSLLSGDQNSNSSGTAVSGAVCGDEFAFEINADGRIRGAVGIENAQPIFRNIDVGISAGAGINQFAMIKSNFAGSATSSPPISFETQMRLPNVSVATTAVEYLMGFSDVGATQQRTTASYTKPTNGCFLDASSSADLQLIGALNGVQTITDSGIATSTLQANFHTIRIGLTSTGCFVAQDGVIKATLANGVLPTNTLRAFMGMALNASDTPSQARMQVADTWLYSGETQ